jgi:hypothetical protein
MLATSNARKVCGFHDESVAGSGTLADPLATPTV